MPDLLIGGDFHLGPLCHTFEERLAEDVVPIFLGDLVNQPRDDADAFFSLTRRWQAANPDLVVVPGNHDPEPAGPWEGVRVHVRRGLRILAIPHVPILYKIPAWTHEVSERTIERLLDPHRGGRFDVVASHAPPHGVLDAIPRGRHLGSHALGAFAGHVDFRLWLTAHVHDQRGRTARIAGRPILNVARTIRRVPLATTGREGP